MPMLRNTPRHNELRKSGGLHGILQLPNTTANYLMNHSPWSNYNHFVYVSYTLLSHESGVDRNKLIL